MACTLVTAFYPIRSKFPKEQYLEWAARFMELSTPVVLFTEAHLVDTFLSLRGKRPLHIIVLPFHELDTWSGSFPDQWAHQHTLNPEGHLFSISDHHRAQQTPELYALWAQKPYFVERAIRVNPFQADTFFWCDIGAFREAVPEEIRQRFPEVRLLPRNQILVQAMTPLPFHERERGADGICGPPLNHEWNHVRLIGGLWGGGKDACLRWKTAFDDMLRRYLQAGRYAGNDQIVMLSTLLEHPHLAMAVKPTRSDINQWFFLEYVLSSLADYKVDLSYL